MYNYGTVYVPIVSSLPAAGNVGSIVTLSTNGHLYHDNGATFDDLTHETIPAGTITLSMQADMPTASLVYRKAAGSGPPETNTLVTLKTDLLLTGTNSGDITLSGQNYISLTGQALTANAVDLSTGNATGILAAARFPALTGHITTASGALATTISAAVVTFAMLATATWSDDTTLAADSSTVVPTMHAVKTYIDTQVTGLKFKQDVRVASTATVTISGPGTAIDGVTLSNGDRILLKNQSTASQNGVYIFNGSASAMTRATDGDTGAELISATFPVREGTANQDTWWTVTNDTITIGSTNLVFTQTGGSGTYTNGAGLSLTGNSFSVATGGVTNAMLAGSIAASKLVGSDIATVGTITTGTWNATIITSAYGGTGNGFTKFTGPTTSEKTFTLPNASATILTDNTLVTAAQGGTGQASAYAAYDALSIHGADIASSGTLNLDSATGNLVDVTGTTTITAITLAEGRERTVRFTGALTLTHGSSLVLPGAASITTAAGDYAVFRGYASSIVRCVFYQKASGTALVSTSSPSCVTATIFEGSGRFTSTTTGGGSMSYSGGGFLSTSSTITSSVKLTQLLSNNGDLELGSPIFTCVFFISVTGTDFATFIGLGTPTVSGSAITFTDKHIGFKVTRSASGTINLYATQADGSVETVSSALTTVAAGDDVMVYFKVNGTSSVDYYWKKGASGTWSAATNLTTRIPSSVGWLASYAVSNMGVATNTNLALLAATYTR